MLHTLMLNCIWQRRGAEETKGEGKEEVGAEEEVGGGAGRWAAVCLDSIHDPSVCHCHSNSQRLQQDGKLHYHRNIFYVPLPSLALFLSLYPPLPPHISVWLSVLLPAPPFSLLCLQSFQSPATLFWQSLPFFSFLSLSLSPSNHSSLSVSFPPSLRVSQASPENVHRLRKLQSLYSFPITPATDTYINIRSRQLNILSTRLRILSIGNECEHPPPIAPTPPHLPPKIKKRLFLVPCGGKGGQTERE